MKKRQPQIENFHIPIQVHQQIRWFNIAMDQIAFMGMLQACQSLNRVIHGRRERERAMLFHHSRDVLAFDILHDQIVRIAILSDVIDPNDIAVIESRRRTSFTIETLEKCFIGDAVPR